MVGKGEQKGTDRRPRKFIHATCVVESERAKDFTSAAEFKARR
jgi:hypothetical protein